MKSEQINELGAALAKAQGEIEAATKNAQNPHFRNTYADLAAVWDACRAPLSKNGLSVIQTVETDEDGFCLVTTLCHSSGQWIDSRMHLLLTKQDMQGLGSAITYARRYSLASIVGIAQEEDDAEGAVDRKPTVPSAIRGESVTNPAVKATPETEAPICCGKSMPISRYNPNEFYCFTCKRKQPRTA